MGFSKSIICRMYDSAKSLFLKLLISKQRKINKIECLISICIVQIFDPSIFLKILYIHFIDCVSSAYIVIDDTKTKCRKLLNKLHTLSMSCIYISQSACLTSINLDIYTKSYIESCIKKLYSYRFGCIGQLFHLFRHPFL